MSKKSRARTEARQANKQTIDCLALQKEQIHESASEQLTYAIVCLIVTIITAVICVIYGIKNIQDLSFSFFLFLLPLIPAGITVIWFVGAGRQQRIARLFDGISYASEETVMFRCRKVGFMERQVSKWHSYLFCVVFYAEDGRVFYYVSPNKSGFCSLSSKDIKTRIVGTDMELVCYRGTEIVKEFDAYKIHHK